MRAHSPRTARLVAAALGITVLLAGAAARAQRFGLWAGNESLPLTRHDVQLDVVHPVAELVLTQEFDNPHPTNLEATFTYPVPAGVVVRSLALWVKDERREARLLERRQAKEIYEGIVRERRDPALLERVDGNTFRIRIFPVLARSRTRVELRFAQLVEPAAGHAFRVTLRKPPTRVRALRLGVTLRGPFVPEAVRLSGFGGELRRDPEGWSLPPTAATRTFAEDIELHYRAPASFRAAAVAAATLQGERVFVAELPLAADSPRAHRLALLLDTSRSMERHLPRLRGLGQALLQRLTPADRLALVPFGLLPSGTAEMIVADAEQRLRWRGVLNGLRPRGGGSFLPAWRVARASGVRQLVLCTDGGSAYHAEELEQLLREVQDDGGLQVSVVATEGAHNEEQLQALARQSGGLYARLERGEELEALAQRLLDTPRPPGVQLEGSGATKGHVVLAGRAPGRLLVAGSLPAATSQALLRLHTGEALWLSLPEHQDAPAAVALYGAAAIEQQMGRIRLFGETPELRAQVVRLSLRYKVVSEYTALLATETDADYQRPTSGEPWQRSLPRAGDDLAPPSFQSTPEPHQILLVVVALVLLGVRSRRPARGSAPASSRECSR
jgi:hypothetical protein